VGNAGQSCPNGLLKACATLTRDHGALLTFDEEVDDRAFPHRPTAAPRAKFRVTPDLTTLGKVIGGGLPWGLRRPSRHQTWCFRPVRWIRPHPLEKKKRGNSPGE